MIKFEYKVMELDTYWESTIQKALNKLGREGWELVNAVHCRSSDSAQAEFIFKRPIIEDEANILE